jgi:hypothetical protein
MAKMVPVEVIVKLDPTTTVQFMAQRLQAEAWEAGMRHALTWLGLKQYGDVMAGDNPHRKADG